MATTNPVNNQLYPFSTEDGKTIPLDIIRPVGLMQVNVPVAGFAASAIIPADWALASFYSKEGCIVQLGTATLNGALTPGMVYPDALVVPPRCLVVSTLLPGECRIISLEGDTGTVFIQRIQKWAGIALRRQVTSQ